VSHVATVDRRGGITDTISDVFFARPKLLTLLLLLPPLLWIGIVYVGSLFALLLQSFYSLDDFSGLIVHQFTLSTYAQLLEEANVQIIVRTVSMAALVTLACSVIAFPIAYYAARYARGWTKALFYLAVMMPLWSSYLVKVYAWKLILAKEGILTWIAKGLHLYDAVGCSGCNDGYKGRVGIYEVMPMNDDIQKIILEGGGAIRIAEAAKQSGVRNLRDSALWKVKQGVTSLSEINRVTKD